ncbi:MAG TPA: hypothetical protein VHV78_03815 [Gemmatimonadaceae bacterium]|jgi:hypothetical protein|nr:hypothetical protein [Gemmatimonadaceae bacterium]
MVSPLPLAARRDGHSFVPLDVANAATRYQAFREVEAEQLALMARHDLLDEWTPDVRAVVLTARHHVREAAHARQRFRGHVRDVVVALRASREPLSATLRQIRAMLELLEQSGAIRNDGGWLEAEVLEWAIQEYEIVA